MKTIAFDARMHRHAGIGRYICELLRALIAQNEGYEFRLLGPADLRTQLPDKAPRLKFAELHSAIYGWQEHFEVTKAARGCDVLHVPHFNIPLLWRKCLVVTVHDLIYLKEPSSSRLGLAKPYARFFLKQIQKKASAVITVSEYSKQDLLEAFPGMRGRVFVVPEAASACFYKFSEDSLLQRVRRELNLRGPFILFVGSLKPHKNVSALIRAFLNLTAGEKISHELVLAGRLDPHDSGIKELMRSSERIKYVGEVSDPVLAALYNLADLFVLPSFCEGFGLPVLEAMACGTPVIASNRTSIPEVVGEAGLLFDPDRVDALEELIYNVLKNRDLRQEMSQAGLERARGFSWEKAAKSTLQIYKQVLD